VIWSYRKTKEQGKNQKGKKSRRQKEENIDRSEAAFQGRVTEE